MFRENAGALGCLDGAGNKADQGGAGHGGADERVEDVIAVWQRVKASPSRISLGGTSSSW